jgi:5-methylcytosine-specific restriction enzyme A
MEAARLADTLSEQYGLPLTARSFHDQHGLHLILEPTDLHPHDGFRLQVTLGWHRIIAVFIPGQFAAGLLAAMGQTTHEKRIVFCSLTRSITKRNGSVHLTVNGQRFNACDAMIWEQTWRQVILRIESPPVVDEGDLAASPKAMTHALEWAGRLLGLIFVLLPLEEEPAAGDFDETQGQPEGAAIRSEVTRYERSRANRLACISEYGARCAVCGLDFSEEYGDIGQGFIHVHHIIPVSQLGGHYVIDPILDLIPVCPNCHAMLHRRVPPYSVEELRALYRNGK